MLFRFRQRTGGFDWIIAGLGNPGMKYDKSRHNTGFHALDMLAERLGADVRSARFNALTGEITCASPGTEGGRARVLLLKPLTYMNLSGKSVAEAAKFYKIPPEHIIIMFDDISLPPGRLRVRASGSAGGHNGLKSLISELHSDAFPRVKIGVGENQYPDLADWVLAAPSPDDRARIDKACSAAGEAALTLISDGAQAAAAKFNGLSF